jgi:hypothetical protein
MESDSEPHRFEDPSLILPTKFGSLRNKVPQKFRPMLRMVAGFHSEHVKTRKKLIKF